MSYRLDIARGAQRQLAALPKQVRNRITEAIDGLLVDPRHAGTGRLTGGLRLLRRLRVGDYRVVYHVDEQLRLIRVVWAGHRSRVYDEVERRA